MPYGAGTGPSDAGLAFGCLVSGFLGGRLRRVRTFQIAAVISLVGVLTQATSFGSYWQVIAGRIIDSTALGAIANTVPAYQAECAPAKIRGTVCVVQCRENESARVF